LNRISFFSVIFLVITVFISIFEAIPGYINDILHGSGDTSSTSIEPKYCIFIEIEDNTLYFLQDGKCVKKYPIASGRYDTPSPVGYWKIISKNHWGGGFGERWLGLNVPWGTFILEHNSKQGDRYHVC